MKRFQFNLRCVAVLRAHQKQRAREAWTAAVRVHDECAAKLAHVRTCQEEFETAMVAGRKVRFDAASEAPILWAYRDVCAEVNEVTRETNTKRVAMIERREIYVNAHRRLEIIHRLEAKARALHREAAQRAEQAEFDDFAGRNAFQMQLSA